VQFVNIRRQLEEREEHYLSPRATPSRRSRGRVSPEAECPLRPAFQRDRDRILYSKAFRRLRHKTQVFLAPSGDHYRTRLTHTLEVAQIARSMAKALRLNEDLSEAIALGHDLGHTPFGHAGESTLNAILPQGFKHWQQSLRVVDYLERDGRGLNLTFEVRMGIWGHSKGRCNFLDLPAHIDELTLEAQLVRAADIMAYIAHDADDAVRGGVLRAGDLPAEVTAALGARLSQQIGAMVRDLIENSYRSLESGSGGGICVSPKMVKAIMIFREFLYKRVYENFAVHRDFIKAAKIVKEIFAELMTNDEFFRRQLGIAPPAGEAGRRQCAVDYVAGMTDSYALTIYQDYFIPRPWSGL
jgi:dGTPase